jgi:AraC-like DNA-binding protein
VSDVVCTYGPRDRPFEETHQDVCIAAVTHGTFQYRSEQGSALLSPGALLLGNDRQCFECGHEHSAGDRCLAFHLTPEFMETVVAAVPRVRRAGFNVSHLPPSTKLAPLIAAAETARDDGDGAELEELALRLAGVVTAALRGTARDVHAPHARDERRVAAALQRIESEAHITISLNDLAQEVAMSPYHFLRVFRQIVGITPHQYVLRTRLHRAALQLRRSDESISTIAFDAGFNDLSTFNRRFRRVMGTSPGAYRAAGRVTRSLDQVRT